jgi:tRNA (uracil-5-)-methyltransferase TRM9
LDNLIIKKLIDLNYQFYQTFSASFSKTRFSVQPGVKKIVTNYILEPISNNKTSLLDIGCGNGELARYLVSVSYEGKYTGIDSSPALLDFSARAAPTTGFKPSFQVKDITSPNWADKLSEDPFNLIVTFAVLHHIPGTELRNNILGSIRRLVSGDGLFIHSEWQFMNSTKLAKRVIPWEKIGLSPSQLDQGDYLLDWRAEEGKTGYRYIHIFSEEELSKYAASNGFKIRDSFYNDGRQGNLAMYQIWQPE